MILTNWQHRIQTGSTLGPELSDSIVRGSGELSWEAARSPKRGGNPEHSEASGGAAARPPHGDGAHATGDREKDSAGFLG